MTIVAGRQAKIADIIKMREPIKAEIEAKQSILRKVSAAISEIQTLQTQIKLDAPLDVVGAVKDIDLSGLQKRINDEMDELEKLRRRFSRPTLNIGVIGRARQGKSRLLQSLSGLSTREIPDGDRESCTGVLCTVYHKAGTVQPYGRVWFYTEVDFLTEVIAPYYKELGLGSAPKTMAQFTASSLPALPGSNVTAKAKYETLRTYVKNIGQYKQWFRENSPRDISAGEIRDFVTQVKADNTPLYNYLAVKEVEITCDFGAADEVGQIALIDMPGLGDARVGDEKRLIEAMGERMDVVLFVRMPSPTGAKWETYDTDLYDVAQSSLQDIPLNRWCFMILNNKPSTILNQDNTKNCNDLKAKLFMNSKGEPSAVECIVANCADQKDVREKVLDIVLNYLGNNLRKLDERYITTWNKRLAELQDDIKTTLESASAILMVTTPEFEESNRFTTQFVELWRKLATSLTELVNALKIRRSDPNLILADYFQEKFELCKTDSGLPQIGDIQALHAKLKDIKAAYGFFLNQMRTHLTHHFVDMDKSLQISMEEVKSEVALVFMQIGLLRNMAPGTAGSDFFTAVMSHIPPSGMDRQRQAFEIFAKYELSLQGFFQSRIRENLDDMKHDETSFQLAKGVKEYEVLESLKQSHDATVTRLQKIIGSWLSEPSDAAWAIVDEFVDQVLYSDRAEADWQTFYWTKRLDIWPSLFGDIVRSRQYAEQWQRSVSESLNISRSESLQFFAQSSSI